ncbi:MAG: hypothetical protein ACI9S7_000181 [Candidatus Paceibacteria bacterium]|jgi:hypothetical protein
MEVLYNRVARGVGVSVALNSPVSANSFFKVRKILLLPNNNVCVLGVLIHLRNFVHQLTKHLHNHLLTTITTEHVINE